MHHVLPWTSLLTSGSAPVCLLMDPEVVVDVSVPYSFLFIQTDCERTQRLFHIALVVSVQYEVNLGIEKKERGTVWEF